MFRLVVRRCTHIGTGWTYRTNAVGCGVHGVVITDSIFEEVKADASGGFPVNGQTIDNNVFEIGTIRGTNGVSPEGTGLTVDADDYTPLQNSMANGRLADARNFLGYDYEGNLTDTSSSNKSIGAIGEPAP